MKKLCNDVCVSSLEEGGIICFHLLPLAHRQALVALLKCPLELKVAEVAQPAPLASMWSPIMPAWPAKLLLPRMESAAQLVCHLGQEAQRTLCCTPFSAILAKRPISGRRPKRCPLCRAAATESGCLHRCPVPAVVCGRPWVPYPVVHQRSARCVHGLIQRHLHAET